MKDAKYLLAYLLPASAFYGLWREGWFYFLPVVIIFVLLPAIEAVAPAASGNRSEAEETDAEKSRWFDYLLYAHVPLLYGLLVYGFWIVANRILTGVELVGLVSALGVMMGSFGINVAHELGHRIKTYEQVFAKALLTPCLYLHFYIEHNRGHHKNVATDADPASARKGETVYAFWIRSTRDSYLDAWRLEAERLRKLDLPVLSARNEMIWFQIAEFLYLTTVCCFFGRTALWVAIASAVVAFLLLETVNYIEHYGLRRALTAAGRYEPVGPEHSWNSDHPLGRIFLYELTRHSDHHFKSTRKYQVLRHFEESPQLPTGYPAALLLALVPAWWFQVMDDRKR